MINICVAADEKFIRYLYVMLLSLFNENRDEVITIYLLEQSVNDSSVMLLRDLSEQYGMSFVPVSVDENVFSDFPTTDMFTVEAYFRLLIPYLLPKYMDKVLYLDADILINGKIRELYNSDLGNCLFGACIDMSMPRLDERRKQLYKRNNGEYFNSGVLLLDLNGIRARYKLKDFINAAKELGYDMPYVDQDLLNYLVYDEVKLLDPYMYNCQVKAIENSEILNKISPAIVHFSGCSPWTTPSRNRFFKKWWNYAKCAPFYKELIESQNDRIAERYFEKDILMMHESCEVMELLLNLKGTGRIERYLMTRDSFVVLYGAGHIADVFLRTIDNSKLRIKGIADKSKRGEMYSIPIKSIDSFLETGEKLLIVVTITRATQDIVKSIRMQYPEGISVISLKELLEEISMER